MVRKDKLHCLRLTVGLENAAGLQEELVQAEPAVPPGEYRVTGAAAEGRVSSASMASRAGATSFCAASTRTVAT